MVLGQIVAKTNQRRCRCRRQMCRKPDDRTRPCGEPDNFMEMLIKALPDQTGVTHQSSPPPRPTPSHPAD
ncbi:hypothetical protein J6590_029490 [Homalodisca vitripennis]|nr:hypothetical protein J6590_029490 [Homalodisca vitripennis]